MLCAISGEAPQVPVVSRKSGNIYEKRLIEAYISENGVEPTTGETLTSEDLVDVKASHSVRPRPPALTSIPALLGVFQEEWDALALETYTLQQNLAQTRQELSTALYQHDAAVRVIARLTRERDEAREALSNISVGRTPVNGTNGDSMQVDNVPLPPSVVAKIESTQASLTKTRRKRPVPEGWATAERISSYTPKATSQPLYPGARFLSVHKSGESILLGGQDGVAGVFSVTSRQVSQAMKVDGGSVTAGTWAGDKAVLASSSGSVKVFDGDVEVAVYQPHSEPVTGLTLHPCGDLVASVSADKSYAIYDLKSGRILTQVFTESDLTCTQFHPDGHLLAAGGGDGQLRFFDVKTGAVADAFNVGGPLETIYFSENGTWVAVVVNGSTTVSIWDLRKIGSSDGPIKVLETGSIVQSLHWDYTAQYLLVGGVGSVSVHQYTKSTKQWSEPLQVAVPATAAAWGEGAQSVLAVNADGILTILA